MEALFGLNMAYRYRNQRYGTWDDRVGLIHLPGPGVNVRMRLGRGMSVGYAVRGHTDFGGIESMPNADWNAAYPDRQGKAILRKEGYYYGWGLSGRVATFVEMPWFDLQAEFYAGHYFSHEGRDRTQEEVTDDQRANDRVSRMDVRLRSPTWRGLFAEGHATWHWREGQLEEFTAKQTLSTVVLRVGAEL
jgi:hypothetical protein